MSPRQFQAHVVENRSLAGTGGYFVLRLRGAQRELGEVTPGQFVMLRGAWGHELLNPRAFSVLATLPGGEFEVMLKVYGRATARMKAMIPGDAMTVTGPLGRGFALPDPAGPNQLLVAGGVGLPPLFFQATRSAAAGLAAQIELLYGGRNRDDLVLLEAFAAMGVPSHLTTEDGSVGERGFVTVALRSRLEQARRDGGAVEVLACGPTPMLRAVREVALEFEVRCWLCLEEEMACGFGVCLGCAVPVYGARPYRYCCTDGPVFDATEVRW